MSIFDISAQNKIQSIHQYKTNTIDGKEFDFSDLKGKKVLIVNSASECGYTPQYTELQKLYEQYIKNNFVIVAFPANNFGAQEPGSNEEIAAFCSKNYGVTFPVMEKSSVKGDDINTIYSFLTSKEKNGIKDSEVKWNFQKYLINEDGNLVEVISHKVSPLDPVITNWIEGKK